MILQGKVALVTGAAKRVGRAIALELASRGAQVLIHYGRSETEARELQREIQNRFGGKPEIFQAELERVSSIRHMAALLLKRFKTVSILVHNASLYEKSSLGSVTEKDWDRHLDVNLKAPFFLSQILGPAMKKSGEGKIIHIGDWAGLRPYTDYIPYCASKAGLLCLNAALAKALAPEVQVNCVMPGPVLLPEGLSPTLRKAIPQATLLKRMGSPEDVARAVLFFIEGDFITGATLAVDGGRLIA